MSISRTVIISCAGMGNRLGLGCTKAVIDICGKPLIYHQLELLKNENDIRIVVGYQAEQVIDIVNHYRKDITYVMNHEYKFNGSGASVSRAMKFSNEFIFTLDGDLLVHPDDMKRMLETEDEFIGGTVPGSDDPWLLDTKLQDDTELVQSFSRTVGNYEWTGLSQIRTKKLIPGEGHVFQLLEPILPIKLMKVRTKEIDTIHDYENAVNWVSKKYME